MAIKIALAGNPNCGKTTLFNSLTGANQFVGNWPGVTVEKKEGRLKGHKDVIVTDLPGIYSLSPYTLEEVVTRNYLMEEKPDVILNLVDGSSIERNLYLTTQLAEMGVPMVVALNMMDVVCKNGDQIDVKKLSEALGCQVIETTAVKGEGCMQAAEAAVAAARAGGVFQHRHAFDSAVESALSEIESLMAGLIPQMSARWFAVKLLERDQRVLASLSLAQPLKNRLEDIISKLEKQKEDDSGSIITNARYDAIATLVKRCVKKK